MAAKYKGTDIVETHISGGDFVLLHSLQKKADKQRFRWIGRRQIVLAKRNMFYDVDKLNSTKVERVYSARMQLYRASKKNTPAFFSAFI